MSRQIPRWMPRRIPRWGSRLLPRWRSRLNLAAPARPSPPSPQARERLAKTAPTCSGVGCRVSPQGRNVVYVSSAPSDVPASACAHGGVRTASGPIPMSEHAFQAPGRATGRNPRPRPARPGGPSRETCSTKRSRGSVLAWIPLSLAGGGISNVPGGSRWVRAGIPRATVASGSTLGRGTGHVLQLHSIRRENGHPCENLVLGAALQPPICTCRGAAGHGTDEAGLGPLSGVKHACKPARGRVQERLHLHR